MFRKIPVSYTHLDVYKRPAQDGKIGIGLHRIANERIYIQESISEHLIMTRQRRTRIAIEWRPNRVGKSFKAYAFGIEDAVTIIEMMRGRTRDPYAAIMWCMKYA